jgi:hypothetical protein
MSLPISVTYTFATATTSIPLSELDSNFTTVVNGINGIGNGTNALSNVSITGGNATVTSLTTPTVNSSSTLSLQTGGTTGLYVDGSQNVGIGTSSPTSKFTMQTTGQNPLTLRTTTTAQYDAATIYLNTSGSSANQGTVLYHGIQSASDSSATTFQIQSYGNNYTYNNTWLIVDYKNNLWQFFNNGTERMRIDSSGNLLVGTTSTSITTNGVTSQTATYGAGNWTISCAGSASTGASNTYTLYSTGASAFRFYVGYDGTIHATSTSITAISDQTLKTNIKPLETGLTEVMKLQPRRFDWINGDGENKAGFIAQEVEQVLPDLVGPFKYNETETKLGLKMGDMIPTLVKAIQELKAEFDAYKASHP